MNLFAHELNAALERHGYAMSYLYTLRASDGTPAIPPAKVARLQRSQTEDITAALTEREVEAISAGLPLQPEEGRRLRAALLGEVVRQLLAGRVSGMSAEEEGERVVRLLMDEAEEEEALRDELRTRARQANGPDQSPTADTNAAVARALEDAAEACGQGELWLGVALATPDDARREDMLALAWNALDRAAQFLAYAPLVAQGSAAQTEWRETIDRALTTIRQIHSFD